MQNAGNLILRMLECYVYLFHSRCRFFLDFAENRIESHLNGTECVPLLSFRIQIEVKQTKRAFQIVYVSSLMRVITYTKFTRCAASTYTHAHKHIPTHSSNSDNHTSTSGFDSISTMAKFTGIQSRNAKIKVKLLFVFGITK